MYAHAPESFFAIKGTETEKGKTLCKAGISSSLKMLRGSTKIRFEPYDMKGDQGATTTVTLRDGREKQFKTQSLMHSEMRAIEYMLNNREWGVLLGEVVWLHNGSRILPSQFKTKQPHCGFCTVLLIAAGLPLSTPTYGNSNLASRLAYQLPVALETSPHFIARVLDNKCYCGFPALKRVLNAFIKCPADQWLLSIYNNVCVDDYSYVPQNSQLLVVDWETLVNTDKREVIYAAWKLIFEQIRQTNKEGSEKEESK